MDKKLTLLVDEKVIDRTKAYARKQNTSLSRLVEEYFIKLSAKGGKQRDIKVSARVKRLTGVVDLPKNIDIKKSYGNYLTDKYSK